jgi:periplasmic divalent cation tolerance protein
MTDNEIMMIMKSRLELLEKITEEVKKNHPYECPEVVGIPILGGN